MKENKLGQGEAFTIIEALLVAAIIAVLATAAIPVHAASLERSKVTADAANERAAQTAAVVEYMRTGKFGGEPASTDAPRYYNEASGKWAMSSDGIDAYGECTERTFRHNGRILQGAMAVADGAPYVTLAWIDANDPAKEGITDLCSGDLPEAPPYSAPTAESPSAEPSSAAPVVRAFGNDRVEAYITGNLPRVTVSELTGTGKCGDANECYQAEGLVGQVAEFVPHRTNYDGYKLERQTIAQKEDSWVWRGILSDPTTNETLAIISKAGEEVYDASGKVTYNKLRFDFSEKVGGALAYRICLHYKATAPSPIPISIMTMTNESKYLELRPGGTGTIIGGPRLTLLTDTDKLLISDTEMLEIEQDGYVVDFADDADPYGAISTDAEGKKSVSWGIKAVNPGTAIVTCRYSFKAYYKEAAKSGKESEITFPVVIRTKVVVDDKTEVVVE